jgi:hypothetical protein
MSIGQVYHDYTPANPLFENGNGKPVALLATRPRAALITDRGADLRCLLLESREFVIRP